MSGEIINFILGPSKAGKTTLLHYLKGSILKITPLLRGKSFKIETCEMQTLNSSTSNQLEFEETKATRETHLKWSKKGDKLNTKESLICNDAKSGTKNAWYYRNMCDFPGFEDSEGDLNTYLVMQNEFQKHEKIRLILVLKHSQIFEDQGKRLVGIIGNLIKCLELTEEHIKGILLVVSQVSEKRFGYFQEDFNNTFKETENFIIKAIKNEHIKVIPFENPSRSGEIYEFKDKIKQDFFNEIENNFENYIGCKYFSKIIKKKIFTILKQMKAQLEESKTKFNETKVKKQEDEKKTLEVVFLSITNSFNYPKTANVLCIDRDFKIEQKDLLIDTDTIVVLPKDKKPILLEIEFNNNPCITFGENVSKVINGKMLVVSTKNQNKNTNFPEADNDRFLSNKNYFRLESFCVNSTWTKYSPLNNKFIDLIMYFNPCFGSINIKPEFKIKTCTVDIQTKIFINECAKKKKK